MKRRIITMLAVVVVAMGVMSPVSAGGVNAESLHESGWDCVDVGAGIHCSRVSLGDFLSGAMSGNAINVMVFDRVDGAFLGTEILRTSTIDISGNTCWKGDQTWHNLTGDVYACHHWHGGSPPPGH
ncbi:MAG: hypothetical protein U9N58_03390 [Thermodesulfobacteriota bacterium]|nr:hypothetical protein [Thermodesulfobacteriota bacterium]